MINNKFIYRAFTYNCKAVKSGTLRRKRWTNNSWLREKKRELNTKRLCSTIEQRVDLRIENILLNKLQSYRQVSGGVKWSNHEWRSVSRYWSGTNIDNLEEQEMKMDWVRQGDNVPWLTVKYGGGLVWRTNKRMGSPGYKLTEHPGTEWMEDNIIRLHFHWEIEMCLEEKIFSTSHCNLYHNHYLVDFWTSCLHVSDGIAKKCII